MEQEDEMREQGAMSAGSHLNKVLLGKIPSVSQVKAYRSGDVNTGR